MIKENLIKFLITFAVTIVAGLSGYFAAYTGVRVELAGKAEERYVSAVEVRLARLEASINDRFATKEDLFAFREEVIAKLVAIETVLAQNLDSKHISKEIR